MERRMDPHTKKMRSKMGSQMHLVTSCRKVQLTEAQEMDISSSLCQSFYSSIIFGSFFGRRGEGILKVGLSHSGTYFHIILNRYYLGTRNNGMESLESTREAGEWGQSGKKPIHIRAQGLSEKF